MHAVIHLHDSSIASPLFSAVQFPREVQACIAMPHRPRWAWDGEHVNDACTCEQVPKATSLLLKALAEWIAAQLEPRASPTARASIVAELRALVDLSPVWNAAPSTPGDALNHVAWGTALG